MEIQLNPRQVQEPFGTFLQDFARRGYFSYDATVPAPKLLGYGLGISGIMAIGGYLYYFSEWASSEAELESFASSSSILLLLLMLASMAVHELLHAVGLWISAGGTWKSTIRISASLQYFTVYCHCKKPVKALGSFISTVMPFLFLGISLYPVAFLLGNRMLLYLSLFNIIISGGDLLVCGLLIFRRPQWVLDHPEKCGFVGLTLREPKRS